MTDGGSSSSPFLAADAPSSRPGLRKGSSSLSFFLSTIRFRDPSSSSSTKAAAAARHHSSIYGGGEGAGASSFGSEDCGPRKYVW